MRKLTLLVSVNSGLSPYVATTPSGKPVATLERNAWPRQPLPLDVEGRPYRIEHTSCQQQLCAERFPL